MELEVFVDPYLRHTRSSDTTNMADKKQQLVLSIIDFLNQSIDDGTVKQDDKEGLEVASAFYVFIRLFYVQ